jgi:GH25 family lysozyme M1 (1,4-beta-N-acetylmuramidase)
VTDLTFGVDISHWQGAVDWTAVERSGLADFAAVRLTIGLGVDDRWQDNLAGAADHVPLPMAYGVVGTRAAQADAADLLVNMVDRVADLARVGLVVDAENFGDGSHPTQEQIHQFRDALKRLTGRWPSGYEPDWFMTQHGYRTDEAPWAHWPSRYVAAPWTPERLANLRPPLEHGFTVQGPWQFTSSGTVAGIAGNVDRNVWFGTVAELRALALGEETDMPLSDADVDAVADEIVKRMGADPNHAYTGTAIRAAVDKLNAKVDALAARPPIGLSAADLEMLAGLIAAKQEVAGHPPYEGEALISIRPKEATP